MSEQCGIRQGGESARGDLRSLRTSFWKDVRGENSARRRLAYGGVCRTEETRGLAAKRCRAWASSLGLGGVEGEEARRIVVQ
jgi:hypothetical protein